MQDLINNLDDIKAELVELASKDKDWLDTLNNLSIYDNLQNEKNMCETNPPTKDALLHIVNKTDVSKLVETKLESLREDLKYMELNNTPKSAYLTIQKFEKDGNNRFSKYPEYIRLGDLYIADTVNKINEKLKFLSLKANSTRIKLADLEVVLPTGLSAELSVALAQIEISPSGKHTFIRDNYKQDPSLMVEESTRSLEYRQKKIEETLAMLRKHLDKPKDEYNHTLASTMFKSAQVEYWHCKGTVNWISGVEYNERVLDDMLDDLNIICVQLQRWLYIDAEYTR